MGPEQLPHPGAQRATRMWRRANHSSAFFFGPANACGSAVHCAASGHVRVRAPKTDSPIALFAPHPSYPFTEHVAKGGSAETAS